MAAERNSLVMSKSSSVRVAEMLIELVGNHPVLYDKRHPKHKDSLLKDDLWRKIGNELGMTGMQAHAKFINLKDTFTKHKNRIKGSMKSGAGAGDVHNVKSVHFEAMMSLMGPILKEPIISTNVGFINPDRASGERSPAPASNTSSGNAEEGQVDHDSYVTVILDEPLEQPASSSGATPANTETDRSDSAEGEQNTRKQTERPRKVPRIAASGATSSKTLSHIDIASECLHQLRAVKAAQESKEQHDLPYFFGMSLVQQLHLLNSHQQVDAITALQEVMQKKISEARLELEFGN